MLPIPSEVESIDHLSFHCQLSRWLWSVVLLEPGLTIDQFSSFRELLHGIKMNYKGKSRITSVAENNCSWGLHYELKQACDYLKGNYLISYLGRVINAAPFKIKTSSASTKLENKSAEILDNWDIPMKTCTDGLA